jgi:hypothetical protein
MEVTLEGSNSAETPPPWDGVVPVSEEKRLSVTTSVNGVGLKQAGQTKASLSCTALLRIGDSNYR